MPPNESKRILLRGFADLRERVALFPRRAFRYAIRGYQLTFSAFAGRQCRHEPSCSAYMAEAVARHGLWAGGVLGLARLCRCHPWGTSGYDPVPEDLPGRGLGIFLFGLRRGRSTAAGDPN